MGEVEAKKERVTGHGLHHDEEKEKAFYETFSKDDAERILSKIEFHYAPKHASWLNAAEIEINVMDA